MGGASIRAVRPEELRSAVFASRNFVTFLNNQAKSHRTNTITKACPSETCKSPWLQAGRPLSCSKRQVPPPTRLQAPANAKDLFPATEAQPAFRMLPSRHKVTTTQSQTTVLHSSGDENLDTP